MKRFLRFIIGNTAEIVAPLVQWLAVWMIIFAMAVFVYGGEMLKKLIEITDWVDEEKNLGAQS